MKICFLCGSLEPGKDGVGDYTRRLSAELIRKGKEVRIISVHDRHLENEVWDGCQKADDIAIPVLRLSSALSWRKRIAKSCSYVENFDPFWLSLQYVPFSFDDKGMPFFLAQKLKSLEKGRRWHIMFHELWVGMAKEDSLKHKIWGFIQRRLIVSFIKKIRPKKITTQVDLYANYLRALGFEISFLPLFGNIPISCLSTQQVVSKYQIVVFGNIHSGASLKSFIDALHALKKKNQADIIVVFLGRNGKELNVWKEALEANGLSCSILGEKPVEQISCVFLESVVGVSTTPYQLVQKSGSFIAMKEHGLPVINVSKKWTPRTVKSFSPTSVDKVDPIKEMICLNENLKERMLNPKQLEQTTELLLNYLNN